MYDVELRPNVDKIFSKLEKKNPHQLQLVWKKLKEILKNPHRYKNLRAPLNQWKRVHIDDYFVLTFSIDEQSKTVVLEDFKHHDQIYG